MSRVFNFSAGPSMLPEEVLKTAAAEMLDYKGSGMSVAEMSHRSKVYISIFDECEALLREVMAIPENYKVLFLQGGASTQFAMVPMNLMTKNGKADYAVTGSFAKKAYKEATKFGDAIAAASSEDQNFSFIPKGFPIRPDADYLHICQNNTIFGTRYAELPETGDIPLVADMSSCILSEPTDVSKYGLIYAGAQKNMAPAGLTVVIIREDLVGNAPDSVPTMLNYKTHVDAGSMYNTPPCYSIYMCKLVLEWIKSKGGLAEMKEINEKKAAMLYDVLDHSEIFIPKAAKEDRSMMNVTFATGDADLDAKFVAGATAEGLVNLKGHRLVGGMRASIYNAMPVEGCEKLAAYMKKFEEENK